MLLYLLFACLIAITYLVFTSDADKNFTLRIEESRKLALERLEKSKKLTLERSNQPLDMTRHLKELDDLLVKKGAKENFQLVLKLEYLNNFPEVFYALNSENPNADYLIKRFLGMGFNYEELLDDYDDYFVDKDCSFTEWSLNRAANRGQKLVDRFYLLKLLTNFLAMRSILLTECVEKIVDKYLRVLIQKRNSLITKDDYGDYQMDKWFREVEFFYKNKVANELKSFQLTNLKILNSLPDSSDVEKIYLEVEDANSLEINMTDLIAQLIDKKVLSAPDWCDGSDYEDAVQAQDEETIDEQVLSLNSALEIRKAGYKTLLIDGLRITKDRCEKLKNFDSEQVGKLFNSLLYCSDKDLLKATDEKHNFNINYDDATKVLVIDASLPSPDNFPKEIEVTYVKSKNIVRTKFIKDRDFTRLYDDVLSQIILLLASILYTADSGELLDSIVINGYANGVDKATGKNTKNCIVSVKIPKDKFNNLNLEKVDPQECLKSFKARIASEFINMSPVVPILRFNKKDKRLIESENVIDDISESTNLAIIEWEKFEYLVRDLFSKMFSENGAEVKVTQASRDKGVDAIVFDPDPIRGGKLIIQCKRYNSVVGVADVRDLWGTVMHEGANKGILVTTSHFGLDSIEWSKDKPITLINGSNLLSLFQQYGYNFRIELKVDK